MSIYMWKDVPYRTFTISWEEKSDMSSWWTYSDDAAWLTAGSSAFDEFFWYSWVRLDTSWNETASITQSQSWWAWKLDITQLWTLTSGDNVMIKFPKRWVKITKSGSIITLSITEEPNNAWYQYFAHTSSWTPSSPWTPNDAFYLWAYTWYSLSDVLKSWSWQTITTALKGSVYCTRAKANGSWYNISWFYQAQYITALYMMKYWNPDCQTAVGKWRTTSPKLATWWTNSQTDATYWTTSASVQCKLFGLEDWWGNCMEFMWWASTNSSSQLLTQLTWWDGSINWENTWTVIQYSWSGTQCISWIAGTNNSMFVPTSMVKNSSYNTYYCDFTSANSNRLCMNGWGYADWNYAGIFYFNTSFWPSDWGNSTMAARLMYMNWLT